jgi:hypothetical protein
LSARYGERYDEVKKHLDDAKTGTNVLNLKPKPPLNKSNTSV